MQTAVGISLLESNTLRKRIQDTDALRTATGAITLDRLPMGILHRLRLLAGGH